MLRDFLEVKSRKNPIPLSKVEDETNILKRFDSAG
ncbi:MAG: hypothetical protein Ct9H90mP20_5630 [Candidatus Neomarinimicrobiota bacterium]|nr:MAG: hypothetical protein Ct9H90mP20_5630 [Candidatus Neomarinimicrobiota bacterium]